MLTLEVKILKDGDVLTQEQITLRQGKVGIKCTLEPGQQIIDATDGGTLVLTEYEVSYTGKLYLSELG